MEYIECQAPPPNSMFEKIMASDNMRVPFTTSGPNGAAYRPMPGPFPVFTHAKTVVSLDRASVAQPGAAADLARRAFIPGGMNMPLMTPGLLHQVQAQAQVPNESASSLLQRDGAMEKVNKRNGRGEGGRGSRGGGTTGRKRTRGGQMTDSLTTGSVLEGSLSGGGGAQSTGRAAAAAANGAARQQNNSNGEKAEKSTGRRQSGQGNKRGEKKQPQPVAPSVSETPCVLYNGHPHTTTRAAEANGFPAGWSSGVLDIYGLRTRPTNIAQYMVEIPLNDLLSPSYIAPKLVLKEFQDADKVDDGETFDEKISGILQLFPVRPTRVEVHGEIPDNVGTKSAKHAKVLLDLESPVPPDYEEGLPKQERAENGLGANFLPGSKTGSDKDTRVGSHITAGANGTTQGATSGIFKIEGLPFTPFEDFMTRLKLGPSDSLQSLIAQAQADNDINVTSDTRMDSAVVDQCHRNGSIPPLPCSYPPVGPVKPEHCRWNHRVWSLQPVTPSNAATCEAGSVGEDAPIGTEEVGSPRSPNSRRRQLDSKVKCQTPEAATVCIPLATPSSTPSSAPIAPLSTPPIEECSISTKEEPRQVENAVVLSSEGTPNPMEVDSCRVDNGALAVIITDRPETVPGKQVDNLECHQERNGGEAVRPLETPATLAGPQEMDICDRQTKPLADVKQEAGEQETKDLVESNGESKPDQTVLKEEQSLALPSLEIKVICPSPQQNEPSTLSAVPLSPRVTIAAEILISFQKDSLQPVLAEPEKIDGEKERRRRQFQPYQGAPTQKATKSMRVSSASLNHRVSGGDGGKEAKTNTEGGSVPPNKATVSERRKSLSQIDTPEKPCISSPRNSSGGGVSTSSRGGSHTAARTSNLSIKMEKCAAKESAKDSNSNKDAGGRSLSALPPLSTGLPSSKSAHKGAKTNGYAHSSNPKGSAATGNFAKVPTAATTQRVSSGGGSRSSRPAHNNNTPASHGTAPVPVKSSRQSIPDGRQKSKTDGSARGVKSSRD